MSQRPTIIDVAQKAGVSKTTVSRLLSGKDEMVNPETRDRILAAIRELGYEPNSIASSLRTNRTNLVMLVIPDIQNQFWSEVARGAQDVLHQAGYAAVVANSDWNGELESEFLRMARRNRFDGLLINPVVAREEEILSLGMPAVVLGLRKEYAGLDQVGSDSYGATLLAVNHLIDLGHQKIGVLLGKSSDPQQSRLAGYRDLLASRGIDFFPNLVVEVPFDLHGGFEGFERLMQQKDKPTAIFAANDTLAIGAMHAAAQHGIRIPQDLSIIGMDDISISELLIPALTTVAKQKYEIGKRAAEFLIERMQGEGVETVRRQVFPCRLVRRSSTAAVG